MKARLARIAGLVLAGILVVSTAAIDQKSKNTDGIPVQPWRPVLPAHCPEASVMRRWGWPVFPEMDVARTAQGQEAVEEGTESQQRRGVDASTSSAAAGVSAELADAATCGPTGAGRTYRRRRAQRSRQRVQSRMPHSRRRALTDTPISVWRMLRAILMSEQRQALMQMSWARCRTTQDVRSSAWKANGHRLSPVPWKVM